MQRKWTPPAVLALVCVCLLLLRPARGANAGKAPTGAERRARRRAVKGAVESLKEQGFARMPTKYKLTPEQIKLSKDAIQKWTQSALNHFIKAVQHKKREAAASGDGQLPQMSLAFKELSFRHGGRVDTIVPALQGDDFAFLRTGPWMDVVEQVLGDGYGQSYTAAIVAFPKSYGEGWGPRGWRDEIGHQPWHRDTGIAEVGQDADEVARRSKCFGIAMFIPLLEMICAGTPTPVCSGLLGTIPTSHTDSESGDYGRPDANITAETGEVLMYDTRLYHRGMENNSTHLRPIIQINFGSKEAIEHDMLQLKKGNYGTQSLFALPIHDEL